MKVFVKGKGAVDLGQANFVAQGGQASVYQKNGTAYKIYSDPKDTIPEGKFRELSRIQDPHVVKPKDLLVASAGAEPIGYTMAFLQDTYALCQLFPRAFRDRNNVDHEAIRRLVGEFQGHIGSVHAASALVVDLNELNILVTKDFGSIHLIDVDSYQTESFKAEVIMPSVRDWSVKPAQFSELSDWFSFAVLVCQMYLGIHPYRGKHEASHAIPADQRLEHRMRHNVSIFDSGVSVPKACYPIDVIPAHQRAWLRAVLQEGKRLRPPPPDGEVPVILVSSGPATAAVFGGSLLVSPVGYYEGTVIGYREGGGDTLAHTDVGVFLNGRVVHRGAIPGTTLIGFTPKLNRPVALNLHGSTLRLFEFVERRTTEVAINATEIARSGERFYVRNASQVLEVDLTDLADRVLVTASHPVANVLESASRLFDGCAIQNMLGSAFVSLFPSSRAGYQVRMPELDSYRVVEARAEGSVLMVIVAQGGQYDRLVFRFDTTFSSYDQRVIPNISPAGLNFVVTRGGICVSITEDELVEAFSARKDAQGMKTAADPAVGADMRLMHVAGRVGFARGSTVSTLSLK